MTGASQPIWVGDDLSDADFAAITDLLRAKRQLDLGQYKDRCIRRRIAKRLRACEVADVAAYLQLLQSDSDELDALLATISIHVSQFFRNPDTYQTLEEFILPDLCQRASQAGRQELQLWSVGCAGGEEPYSLALLIDEMAPELAVHILGTDISAPVLAAAREGLYESARLKEVPAKVLQTYFVEEDGRYRLHQRIRQKVRFQRHNIMTAAEFPAADLIVCRNVLIYFSRAEQERILTRFSQSLSPWGALVLGRSETLLGTVRDKFQVQYPVERIYRLAAGSPG